ncbi:MAG: hypothetical protein U9Q69_02025 [Nanoarchaeota archaeon]|nr:hypothetical protein [Nanoarchaeota archaeon]
MQMFNLSEKLFEEMHFISKITNEIVGKTVECEGLLLTDYGGTIARYTCLPCQQITPDNAQCSSLKKAFNNAYSKNQKVLGIWHSHGDFDVKHSSDDFIHLSNTILPLVKEYAQNKNGDFTLKKIKGGIIIKNSFQEIYIKSKASKKLKKIIQSCSASLDEKVTSIIINAKNESGARQFPQNKKIKLNLVPDHRPINYYNLIKDVGKKFYYGGKCLADFQNYKSLLNKYNPSIQLSYNRLKQIISYKSKPQEDYNSGILSATMKIISGNYKIKNKRIWSWKERLHYFNFEYLKLKNKENIHKELNGLIFLLENNHYPSKEKKEIKEKLEELKFRSLFKKIRRQRINVRGLKQA